MNITWKFQLNLTTFDSYSSKPLFLAECGHVWACLKLQNLYKQHKMVHYSLVYYKMKMIWRNQSNSSTYDWFMAKNHTFRAFWAYIEPKWANSGKTRFFGGNSTRSLLTPYSALTSCKKSEKSLEPFSSNMGITLLLGPFWAIRPLKYHISAHFGKTGFFPEKRPCTFLALIVVNLIPEYEENPWSGFWEISVTTNY